MKFKSNFFIKSLPILNGVSTALSVDKALSREIDIKKSKCKFLKII